MDRLNSERLDELLAAATGVRVLVVGDLMLDRYIAGPVDRVSPEAPVPVVRVAESIAAVGGAGNVAANIAALGATCRVVACVGNDQAGGLLENELERLGVHTDGLVRTDDRPTTEKTRVLALRQQIVRFDVEDDSDVGAALARTLSGKVDELAAQSDVLVVQDYNKGVLVPSVVSSVLENGARLGLPTVVDPKRRNFFTYRGATVFKPNAKELGDALGDFIHADDADWMEATRRKLGCENLLLTLGEDGMALQTAPGTAVRIPAAARAVYDVSGAGDTVTAIVAVVLAAGGTPAEAAMMANHAAAIEVAKAGVATVSPEELRAHVARHAID